MRNLARWLFEPTDSLQEPAARVNAGLLAALLFTLLLLVLTGALALTFLAQPTGMSLVLWCSVLPLLASYALSRTRHFRIGATLSVLILSLIPYVSIAVAVPRLPSALVFLSLSWLSLPVLLVSLFFSMRTTVVYAALINLSLVLLPVLVFDVDPAAAYLSLGLVFTISIFAVLLRYHREQIERLQQASLAESEARYQRLTENALDIVYRYNLVPPSRIIYINPIVFNILGYTPDEFYADPDLLFNLVQPDDRPRLLALVTRTEAWGNPTILRWVNKAGALIWLEHRNVPVIDQTGNLIAVDGIARDVTNHKQAEIAMARRASELATVAEISTTIATMLDSERLLQSVVDLTKERFELYHAHIYLLDPADGVLTLAAGAGEVGQQMTAQDWQIPLDRERSLVARAARTRQGVIINDVQAEPDFMPNKLLPGTRAEMAVPMIVGDKVIGVFDVQSDQLASFGQEDASIYTTLAALVGGALQNARLFEQTQAALAFAQESQAALNEVMIIADMANWKLSPETLKFTFNDRFYQMLGTTAEEEGGYELSAEEYIKKYAHPEDAELIAKAIQVGFQNPDPPNFKGSLEHRLIRKDGQLRYILTDYRLIVNEQGNIVSAVGSFLDITERKLAEVQVERNARHLAILEHLGQTVVASLDLTVVLARVIEEISALIGAQGVSVLLLEDHDSLVFAATNESSVKLLGQRMPVTVGIAGEVARTGQSVWVGTSVEQARIHRDIDQAIGFHTQSLLAVPLNLHGEIIGVMEAVHTQPGAFSGDDLHLLEAAATWTTMAITNARLFETERRRVQEQAALLEITQMALSSFEFSLPVAKHIARRIAQACHASQCLLFLLEEQASVVRPVVAQYADGHEDPDIQQVLDIIAAERLDMLPALGTIMRERRPHLFKDAHQASLLPEEWWSLFGLKQALAVPLLGRAEVMGLMVLGYESDQVIGSNFFDLALTIGAQIAIAFANVSLYADLQQALQHEREARAQAVQAEKLAAIGRLAASVAHELNNPLQVIQNSLYLVRHESELDQQAQADLDVALTESRRMAELIERMRETYRPATTTEFRPESINELIGDVEKLISTHLRHNKVIYEFQPAAQLPPVLCLRDQLKQVVLNLSLNAVEAMPDGGQLTIGTSDAPELNGLWMTFTDTGDGIDPADLPNIFDPFFTRKAGGTGLGLAICYDIIQHHQGQIEVDSELGRGTTFRVWLPTKGS